MPNAPSHDTITRLWALMQHIPTKPPGVSTRELVERLESEGISVTKRTIERDLQELSRHFGLTCNDKGTPFGWYWMIEANMNGLRCLEDVEHRKCLRDAVDSLNTSHIFSNMKNDLNSLMESGTFEESKTDTPFTEQQKTLLKSWFDSHISILDIVIGFSARRINGVLRGEKFEDISVHLGKYDNSDESYFESLYAPEPFLVDIKCPYCGASMEQYVSSRANMNMVCRRWHGGCGRTFYASTGENGEIISTYT